MLDAIKQELSRLSAEKVRVSTDREFDREAGELIKIELDDVYWHMHPQPFLEVLKDLPDGAGEEGVRMAIENGANPAVYRGPSPDGTRDT